MKLRRWKRKIVPIARRSSIEKFVFIVTYGRSGSTLVQGLIGGLDGAHIVGENNGVPFKLAQAYRASHTTLAFSGELSFRPLQPWYGAFAMSPRRFGKSCADLIMRHVLRPPWGTRIAGFKEVRWQTDGNDLETSADVLSELFAPAYFVVNIRGVDATSRSGWWKQMDPDEAKREISGMRDELIAFAERREDAYLIDHDVYTKDHSSLRGLFEFLGEPYDESYVQSVLSRKLTHTGSGGRPKPLA